MNDWEITPPPLPQIEKTPLIPPTVQKDFQPLRNEETVMHTLLNTPVRLRKGGFISFAIHPLSPPPLIKEGEVFTSEIVLIDSLIHRGQYCE